MWILAHLRLVAYTGAILLALGAFWVVNGWREDSKQLEVARAALKGCNEGKEITRSANDDLQKDRDIIAAKLAHSKRLYSSCVSVSIPAKPGGSGTEHARPDGLSTNWLLDYAATCETYRSQRIVLEKFITDERK